MDNIINRLNKKYIKTGKLQKSIINGIGQIFFIVVGILGALEVDNWNENRQEIKQGNIYIAEIFDDLREDIDYIESLLLRLREQSEAAKYVLEVFESKDQYVRDTSTFSKAFYLSSKPLVVQESHNTFFDLKASGQISIIQDEPLIDSLHQFYTSFDELVLNFSEYPKDVRLEKRILDMETGNLSDFNYRLENERDSKHYLLKILDNRRIYELLLGIYKSCHVNQQVFENLLSDAKSLQAFMENNHGKILEPHILNG